MDGVILVGKVGEGSVPRLFVHQIPMARIGSTYDVMSFLPRLVLLDPFPFLLFAFGAGLLAHRILWSVCTTGLPWMARRTKSVQTDTVVGFNRPRPIPSARQTPKQEDGRDSS